MSEFLHSIMKVIDITAIVDFFMDNIVWIVMLFFGLLAFLLSLALFKGKKKWIWRAVMTGIVCVVTLFFTNFDHYYDAYTDYTVGEETAPLGEASRFQIGNTRPDLAKEIEFLIVGVDDVDEWSGTIFARRKEYTDGKGAAVLTKYFFWTTMDVATENVRWHASCIFGSTSASIEYLE